MNLKKKSKVSKWVVLFLLFIFSCRKTEDLPTFYNSDDYVTNFEAFWHGVNDNYIFFSYDNVNWDDVYTEFRPKVTSGMSENGFKSVIFQMMDKLIDGHRLVYNANDTTTIYNGFSTNNYSKKHPYVDNDNIILNNYIETDTNYSFLYSFYYIKNATNIPEFFFSRVKSSNLFYLRCYEYHSALENIQQNDDFNFILKSIQESKLNGLILDLRGNGGGTATAFKNLISKFVQGNYTWGYSKFRLGKDRYEMTPFVFETASFSGTQAFTKPLVILLDRYSFSASELTALALHNLPNVTLIGDTTGGAQGPIISIQSDRALEKDFTGNFRLPNNWLVQLAERATFDSEKRIFEGKGLPPDILIKPIADTEGKKDNVLDRAILLLEQGQ